MVKHSCWANAIYAGKDKLKCSVCGKELVKPLGNELPRLRTWQFRRKKK